MKYELETNTKKSYHKKLRIEIHTFMVWNQTTTLFGNYIC